MFPKPVSPLLRAWYKWKMLRLPWRRRFLVGFDLDGNTYWEFLERGAPKPPPPSATSPQRRPPTAQQARWRRIVRYPRGTPHDAVVVSPAWHQWLRYTRADPPSLDEQRADVARLARIKELAAAADARWEAKPRLTDAAATSPSSPVGRAMLGVRGPATLTGSGGGPPNVSGKFETGEGVIEGVEIPTGKGRNEEVVQGGREKRTAGLRVPGDDGAGDRDKEAVDQREDSWRRTEEGAAATKRAAEPDPWKQTRGGPSENWQPEAWQPAARPKK